MTIHATRAPNHTVDLDWSEQERRQYERHAVSCYLRVFAIEEGVVVGDVVDISAGGFKIVGSRPMVPGRRMQLRLEYGLESGRHSFIELEARCVWYDTDDATGLDAGGFAFCELSASVRQLIARLIAELTG